MSGALSQLAISAINPAFGIANLLSQATNAAQANPQAAVNWANATNAALEKAMMMGAITGCVIMQQIGPHIPMLAKATNEGIAAVGEVIKGFGEVVPF